MLLFFSTSREHRPPDALSTAEIFGQWHGYSVWSIRQPLPLFLNHVTHFLTQRRVLSACVLEETPPKGKEWIFFEWHGRLLVDFRLIDQVFGDNSTGWEQTQTHESLGVAIFQPIADHSDFRSIDDHSGDFATQAKTYRELLEAGETGEIVLKREWLEAEGAYQRIFGQYSDPKIGGAIALLTLSGAADPRTDEFTLRTPAALELDIEMSGESLVGDVSRELLAIRCLGCSHLEEIEGGHFATPFQGWIRLYEEAKRSTPAAYFIALELDADVDPTIAIRRGAVFEQTVLAPIQTLAVTKDERTVVNPGEVKPLILPAYCLNAELAPPRATPLRPTPFIYRRARGSQGEVWQARRGR
jgi:hypothetical protein